jgi:hypothetical protein
MIPKGIGCSVLIIVEEIMIGAFLRSDVCILNGSTQKKDSDFQIAVFSEQFLRMAFRIRHRFQKKLICLQSEAEYNF